MGEKLKKPLHICCFAFVPSMSIPNFMIIGRGRNREMTDTRTKNAERSRQDKTSLHLINNIDCYIVTRLFEKLDHEVICHTRKGGQTQEKKVNEHLHLKGLH